MTTKERPILFNGAMVQAILDGRKTQTRRVVKPRAAAGCVLKRDLPSVGRWERSLEDGRWRGYLRSFHVVAADARCPYGQPGDRLWVRETWRPFIHSARSGIYYKAGGSQELAGQPETYRALVDLMKRTGGELIYKYGPHGDPNADEVRFDQRWRPPLFMPRWASRITLEVTGVRVERVQEITAQDVVAEGLSTKLREYDAECDLRDQLRALWDSGARPGFGWDANPWVWVVEFRKESA